MTLPVLNPVLRLTRILTLAAPVALAACSPSWQGRAPMSAPAAGRGGGCGASVAVHPGDTLYSIARRCNISVRDLIEANRLDAPYVVNAGQTLRLPGGGEYVVQRGDALLVVARKLQVDFQSLARVNGKTPPYTIFVGEKLKVPGSFQAPPPMMADRGPVSAPPPPASPVARNGGALVIASPNAQRQDPPPSRASTRITAVAPPPPGPPAGAVVTDTADQQADTVPPPPPARQGGAEGGEGTQLAALQPAPAPRNQSSSTATGATIGAASPAQGGAATPAATSVAAAVVQPAPVAVPAAIPVTAPAAVVPQPPPALAGKGFIWPVKGDVVSDFGPLGKGQNNDGVNIAAARGTPIRATENGVVAYVGNELKGFGNLLLIKHSGGWVSAYAHADQLMVHKGDTVKRGQQIATVGSSGGVDAPQLHFELRKGTEAVNPTDYLSGSPGA